MRVGFSVNKFFQGKNDIKEGTIWLDLILLAKIKLLCIFN